MNDESNIPVGDDLRRRVRLRPVGTRDDEEFLLALYATTRADELALTNWDAPQRESFLRMQLAAQKEHYFARFPDSQHSIVMLDESMIGRTWVARTALEFRLLDIALLPAYLNLGIGTLLVSDLIAEATIAGKRVRHMVLKTNPDALRFYVRLGFNVIDEVSTHFHMERLPQENAR